MPDLTLWKNRQIHRMKQEIDQMFGELYRQFGAPDFVHRQELFFPEIFETEDELTIVFELPGLDPEKLEVLANENSLRLQVSTKEQIHENGRKLNEHKSFSGTLQLPCRIMPEKATALIKDTTLRIVMPKCRPGGLHKIPLRHL